MRGCWEWAQDKFTERDVKLINKGRSGGSGTSERDRGKHMSDKDREREEGSALPAISEMQMEIMTRKGNVQRKRNRIMKTEKQQEKKNKNAELR